MLRDNIRSTATSLPWVTNRVADATDGDGDGIFLLPNTPLSAARLDRGRGLIPQACVSANARRSTFAAEFLKQTLQPR